MANITYNIYRRYSKTEKPIPVATGLVNPTYEIPNIDYDRDVYLSVGRVTNKLEVYGEEYKYFIPFETPTIEASYADGVITVSWGDNPIYVDDLYLYTSNEVITEDALPPPTVLGKGVKSTTVNKVLAADEVLCIRLGSVRNNKIKLSNEVSVSVFEAPYDVVANFKDDAINLSWKLDGFVDEQRYYCSETPIDINNLPEPKQILVGDVRTYVDTDIKQGKTYYIAFGAVKDGITKTSIHNKISTITSFNQFRIHITANNGATDYTTISEIELAIVANGTDVTTPQTTITASSAYSGFEANKIIDNNAITDQSSVWISKNSEFPQQITLTFIQAISIVELRMWCQDGEPNRAPKDFMIQGSNDGVVWNDLTSFINVTNWLSGTVKKFNIIDGTHD